MGASKVWDVESEQEEHSLSLSQHSSPTQSDQEQTPAQKANASAMDSQRLLLFKQFNQMPTHCGHESASINQKMLKNSSNKRSPLDLQFLETQKRKQEQYLHVYNAEHKPVSRGPIHHLVVLSHFRIPFPSFFL